jgi:hypothetical protein
MPCFSGHTPQQMLVLLAFVTEGLTPFTILPIPLCQEARTGIALAAMYSAANPSTMKTMIRCRLFCRKAGRPSRS